MEEIFTGIYENKVWGDNYNTEYSGTSGGGSNVQYNLYTYVPFLQHFIQSNDITSVVDLGCGDFRCGPYIYDSLPVSYTGYDAYKKVVDYNAKIHRDPKYTFIHLDFFGKKESIVKADLCILKDVIQHWSLESIYSFIDYLVVNKVFKYILICNCCNQTSDNPESLDGGSRPLSCDFLPLKRYNPTKMYTYNTKEVSIIIPDTVDTANWPPVCLTSPSVDCTNLLINQQFVLA